MSVQRKQIFQEQAAPAQYRRLSAIRDKAVTASYQNKLGSSNSVGFTIDDIIALVEGEMNRVFPPPRVRKKKPTKQE